MDYVRKGTLRVSFTEERTYKLCFVLKIVRILPRRKMREDIPRRKTNTYKGS